MSHEIGDVRSLTAEQRFVPLSVVKSITHENVPEQRTHEWFKIRKEHNGRKGMSSSQFGSLFFIKDADDFRFRYSVLFEGQKDPPDARGLKCMQWGTDNEHRALMAWLEKHPNMIVTDAAFTVGSSGIAASPDGYYICQDKMGCIEIKCPYGKSDKSHPAHTKPVWYYVSQMHCHMHVSGMDNCIFISWGTNTVRSWMIPFCSHFFQLMLNLKESFLAQNYELFLHDREKLREEAEKIVNEAVLI